MKYLLTPLPFLLLAPTAQADISANDVLDLMRFDELIWIVRAESMVDNAELPQTFLGAGPSETWQATLEGILDEPQMLAKVEANFLANLTEDTLDDIYDFLSSDAWQQAITLEFSAREAMLDEGIEDAANEAYFAAVEADAARLPELERLVTGGDLVESNVVGAFNSMFSFYQGLNAGGFELGLSEEQLFELILEEEDTIRTDVSEWVYSFLYMAYDPLSDAHLEAQINFVQTPAGKTLNNALFVAFDTLYTDISFDLGEALARAAMEQAL